MQITHSRVSVSRNERGHVAEDRLCCNGTRRPYDSVARVMLVGVEGQGHFSSSLSPQVWMMVCEQQSSKCGWLLACPYAFLPTGWLAPFHQRAKVSGREALELPREVRPCRSCFREL